MVCSKFLQCKVTVYPFLGKYCVERLTHILEVILLDCYLLSSAAVDDSSLRQLLLLLTPGDFLIQSLLMHVLIEILLQ